MEISECYIDLINHQTDKLKKTQCQKHSRTFSLARVHGKRQEDQWQQSWIWPPAFTVSVLNYSRLPRTLSWHEGGH